MSGHGFQFTPAGIIPLGAPIPDLGDEPAPAAVRAPRESAHPDAVVTPSRSAAPTSIALPTGTLTGANLVKMARARLKELDAIVPKLERERAELRRLVDASRAPRKSSKLTQ